MTVDLQKFEHDFQTWAQSASLPELARCLDLVAQEVVARGAVARSYMSTAAVKLAMAIVPSASAGLGWAP